MAPSVGEGVARRGRVAQCFEDALGAAQRAVVDGERADHRPAPVAVERESRRRDDG